MIQRGDIRNEGTQLRVLHILDHSLPLHSGYTFRTRAIMKAQLGRGWSVAGLTGARHTMTGPDPETVDGLTFFRTPKPAEARSPLREWREIAALAARLDALIDEWKPDQLHVHSPVLNAMAVLRVARRRKLPVIYEIRAFWEDAAVGNGTGREGSPRYRLTRLLETRAARAADAVAVICEGLRGDLIARGIAADKIIVSPNGVDLELFGDPPPPDAALAAQLGLEGKEVVGFIGSFYDYEGLDDLISAMPRLVERRPDACLLLVGGGPMEAALRAQAEASPVADRIRFVGRVPHGEVERYYGLVDILAYPRKAMRLTDLVTPLKPLEAMAQKRLVAASDVGGHRELIEHGVTGTLFPADDPAALADSLADLFANRAIWEERRTVARAFVERDRNWSSNISRYVPVYQKLTGKAL
ncbi:TIGR04063 family PEP-CTERM/XrtA system glycosyltransferase [Flavisphingomonas formosensis]|uniref:TIGR04063 family PEP-CTERM/XrtA system glycosyltransferase n=1 Tax=Flavisphingomonas formosensis TaxID=861534 RepID=UPI0012FCFCA2|nr:TIGR04063 family PEP-CTERM/XrtA system glycosyltransferase [Sphingomonas formosensis]